MHIRAFVVNKVPCCRHVGVSILNWLRCLHSEMTKEWFMWRRVLQVSVSEMEGNKTKGNPMQSMRACGGVELQLYSFFNLRARWGCLASC
jgi:hypothetical protein